MAAMDEGLGPDDLRLARQRVARGARVTPLLHSDLLTERLGHTVALKCENLQAGGAFKIRGATNFVASLDDEARSRGLITYSSGNHAIALSLAARRAGVPAVVVMPDTAPAIKRELARALGAELHFCGTTSIERHERARVLAEERGLTMVPPFDHPAIVAGQSTAGVEILEQLPEAAAVVVPVGGGGLLAGIALACAYHKRGVRVIGVEPKGAPKMSSSLAARAPVTLSSVGSIADGLLPSRPGDITFAVAQRYVHEVVTVEEGAIADAARRLLTEERLLVEWSGAVGVAALLSGMLRLPAGPVAIVLSGGNADPAAILASGAPAGPPAPPAGPLLAPPALGLA